MVKYHSCCEVLFGRLEAARLKMKQLMQLLSSLLILVMMKRIYIEGSAVYKDLLHSVKGKLLTKSHYIVGRALTYGVIRIP